MFAKSSEARFCNIFKNFWNYTRSNQILYKRKKTHSEKYILLRRVFFAILCLVESIRCIESSSFFLSFASFTTSAWPTVTFSLYGASYNGRTRRFPSSAVRMAERSRAPDLTIRPPSEVSGSNPTPGGKSFLTYKNFFLIIGDKISLSPEVLASLVIALQWGIIEKTQLFLS